MSDGSEKIWWYAVGQEKFGPCTGGELARLARKGVVMPDTLVWREGMTEWVRASKLTKLWERATQPPALNADEQLPPPPPAAPWPPCRSWKWRAALKGRLPCRLAAMRMDGPLAAQQRPADQAAQAAAPAAMTAAPAFCGPFSSASGNISTFPGARGGRNAGISCCFSFYCSWRL